MMEKVIHPGSFWAPNFQTRIGIHDSCGGGVHRPKKYHLKPVFCENTRFKSIFALLNSGFLRAPFFHPE